MKKPEAFIFLILTAMGALWIAGCSANKEIEPPEAAFEENLKQFVEKNRQDGAFVMDGLPWLITKQEVKDSLEQKEIQLEEDDRIVVDGDLSPDDAVEHTVIYHFQEDRLVSGENWFVTSDELAFKKWSEQMLTRAMAFPEPVTQVADQAGSYAIWEGKDRSSLRLHQSTTETDEFLLQLQVSSPLLERQGLQ